MRVVSAPGRKRGVKHVNVITSSSAGIELLSLHNQNELFIQERFFDVIGVTFYNE